MHHRIAPEPSKSSRIQCLLHDRWESACVSVERSCAQLTPADNVERLTPSSDARSWRAMQDPGRTCVYCGPVRDDGRNFIACRIPYLWRVCAPRVQLRLRRTMVLRFIVCLCLLGQWGNILIGADPADMGSTILF